MQADPSVISNAPCLTFISLLQPYTHNWYISLKKVYHICCRQPRIGKLLNFITLIFWTGYNTLGNVYAFFVPWLRDYAGQFLFVSGQRAQTLDTPWSVGRQWFERKGDFSVSVLSMFIRAIFAFECRVFVIFVQNVISRLIRCAYFVIFVIVRRYIFFW